MRDESEVRRWVWGLPASLVFHALLAALLIYGLQVPSLELREEQAVSVTFVPPADEPKPPPEEKKAEKLPEPKPPEQKAEKPPEPKAEKPPEPKAEKPPPPPPQAMEQPKPSKIEVLRPVYEFGEKDAGPRKSLNGNSAEDNTPSPAKENDPKPPVTASEAEERSAAPPPSEQQPADEAQTPPEATSDQEAETPADQAPADAEQPAAPEEQASLNPQAETQPADAQGAVKPPAVEPGALPPDADKPAGAAPTPPTGEGEVALPATAAAPQPRPSAAPRRVKFSKPGSASAAPRSAARMPPAAPERYSGLPGVRVLRSDVANGGARATTSMDGVPRDQRVAKLCASALQQQLVSAAYSPNLVPLIPLKAGNVLDIPDAAFRMRSTWYNLSFRCEVDPDATRVLSFAFDVGHAIPPQDWERLGLPMGD